MAHLPLGEDRECKHAEDRAVGIAGQHIHGIYHAGIVEYVERHDAESHHHRHEDMYALSACGDLGFTLVLGSPDVHCKRGGECRECRTCCCKGRRGEAHHEDDTHSQRQIATCSDGRKQLVALRHLDAMLTRKEVEQHAQS